MLLFAGGQLAAQAFRPNATRRQIAGPMTAIFLIGAGSAGGALATGFFNRQPGSGVFQPPTAAFLLIAGLIAFGS